MSVGHTVVTTPGAAAARVSGEAPAAAQGSEEAPAAALKALVGEPVIACETPQDECGVRDVLDRLGDKWSVYVVVELAGGVLRFKELQRRIHGGISQRMLTLTVRRLERDGLVKRTVHPTIPPQVEYELTEMGHSMTHLIKSLADWSIAHRPAIAAAREAYDGAQKAPDAR
ncbi:winged helix-turn-helix transcriptional regulator [Streptomyces sp. AN091965]|uniref:winged helix-turn-helix transcriptional regulator n=1 Tax=Streptomyces sp. AN091965 TaxID=2927803 RepID=UPI001F61C6B0|nr:helix-turn-helix domain-containing protein [Streptomyces sp. AN091965]MCI3931707.1 helix-turn-helix transcriptional regulator [Streptomyces sp. AN091965]